MNGFTQEDSTKQQKPDTIKIGGMVIIREPGSKEDDKRNRVVRIGRRRDEDKEANISTNWWIFDIGFSNYSDRTNYTSAAAQAIAPGSTEDWFKLRAGRSRSVNIWILMQRLNMINHVVNLKYGVGLELNNYHFENDSIRFQKVPTTPRIDQFYNNPKKNKLAADYLTVPVMLNFNFTPGNSNNRSYGISAGISAGFLYSSRQKIKDKGDKDKTRGNFDLRKWKISYVAEIALGPVKLYGSLATKSMFEKGLDLTPYNVGFRFSNW
jgi:hypothetical protein